MKIFKILLVVAIAFGMMACNNEQDVPQVIDGPEATISVKVFPSTNSPGVRSVGDLSGADATTSPGLEAESAVKTLEVWIFSGDVLTGYKSAAGAEVTDIEAIAGASTVVVVANANIGIKGSKADLLDEVKGLPISNITAGGLVMTAEPIDVTLMAGNNYYGYSDTEFDAIVAADPSKKTHLADGKTALPLVRVNARVAIVGATLNYDAVPPTQQEVFDELRDVEVAMFNVPEETNLFYARTAPSASFLATNDAFQYGQQWPSPDLSYVGVNDVTPAPNSLLFAGPLTLPTTPHNLIENTLAPYFYVNENTSATAGEKMIIVLRAKPYKVGAAVTSLTNLYTDTNGYTYYPVWVNLDGIASPSGVVGDGNVYRNTQYNVTLTIKGLGRPSIDPIDQAFLDVKVEVAPWNVVDQNVVW